MATVGSIAIIIPTYQEETTLATCLEHLQPQAPPFHVLVVDGGSSDATLSIAQDWRNRLNYPLWVGLAPQRGRAAQMNWGSQQTDAEILLFLHADSHLPPQALSAIQAVMLSPEVVGGRFHVRLDSSDWPYPLISWGINSRSRLTGMFTGDMGIFIRRTAFQQLGGYPIQPLMEDLELAGRMGKLGKKVFLPEMIITSSRRWQQKGPWKTVALMQILRASYRLGIPASQLAQWYQTVR
ncbi:MAG: TIGR04283 family arsenosugar biosynthesis glycosyltransferase [Cyanobacteriota bacterium]|nr:TIGR04283 family arsenosugar biosynthesis glycosyltransferase [Cyanobacteriota bacterium]